jgi:ParB family chromosome partitioning protein
MSTPPRDPANSIPSTVASPIRDPFPVPVQLSVPILERVKAVELKKDKDKVLRELVNSAYNAYLAAPNATVARFTIRLGDAPQKCKVLRDPVQGVVIGFANDDIRLSDASRAVAQRDTLIELSKIAPNPNQPRKLFEREALEELAASIRQHGLLQPLVVRQIDEVVDQYQIIAGERRFHAAKLAGLVRVPCRVLRNISDEQAFILSVSENVARRDMTIIEEAKAYSYLVALGKSREEVAGLFGKTPEHVGYRIDLLRLRDDLQELAARGQMSRNMAWYVSRLSLNGQARVMGEYMKGKFKDEDAACRFAAAIFTAEQQGDLGFEVLEQNAFLDVAKDTVRATFKAHWDKLGDLGKILDKLAEMDAQQVALALGPDTAYYSDGMDLIAKQVSKVRTLTNQAYAVHQASQIVAAVA